MFWHALHPKFLTLLGVLAFHSLYQNRCKPEGFELSLAQFLSLFLAKWYAHLTLNFPLAAAVHTKLSARSVVLKGMLKMESASCSRKTSRIMLVFHAPLFALMSALTLVSTGRILCGEDIRNVVGLFVHLSFQMLICFPLPTCHLTPSLIRDWADQILLQAKDGWWPFLACIKSSSGKYLF